MISGLFILTQFVLFAALGWAVLSGWDQVELSGSWVRVAAGLAFCAGAGALAGAALFTLRESLHVSPAPREGAEFVEHGIYRHLRHPMYTAVVAFSLGIALIVLTLPVVLASLALIVFYLVKSRYEEGLLLEHYPQYGEYKKRTRGVLFFRGLP
jgi:protein-S-isoprenylcysteine O-methyltransferase Ste14